VAELRAIYEEQARPDRLVLAVAGAVKAEEVRDLVEKLFGDWQSKAGHAPPGPIEEVRLPPEPPAKPDLIKLVRDREQTQIVIGFLGTTLSSPDRYPLEILDTVLSGQSGRLFSELRDRQSLAYNLSSFSHLGLDTGSFGIYIGTSPDKKDQAIKAIWREMFRVRQEPISQEELVKARNLLISRYELGLQTHGAQALEMALNETYGLGQDFGNRYIQALNEVTPDQVLAVAQHYIMPDHYVMVTAGAEGTSAPAAGEAPAEVATEDDEPSVEVPDPAEEQSPIVAPSPESSAPEDIPSLDPNENPESR
jgi:zinc protease